MKTHEPDLTMRALRAAFHRNLIDRALAALREGF